MERYEPLSNFVMLVRMTNLVCLGFFFFFYMIKNEFFFFKNLETKIKACPNFRTMYENFLQKINVKIALLN